LLTRVKFKRSNLKMTLIPQIQRKTLCSLMILCLLVPAPIFCQTSPSLPAATAPPPAPVEIPNSIERATPIARDVFAKLLKVNPFQALLDYIRSTNNPQPDIVPLAAAISAVQQALEKYKQLEQEQHRSGSFSNLDLNSAEFDFKVTRSTAFGVNLSWVIITIGAKRTDQEVNDATFTYTVPKPKDKSEQLSLMAAKTARLEEDLVPALQQAALAAENEFTWGGKKFNKQVTITLQYGVEVKLDVAANIPVYTLTVGPSASWAKNAVQSVKLVFKEKGT
jgi:hypothetical protein